MDPNTTIDSDEVLRWLSAPVDLSFPSKQRSGRTPKSSQDRRHACTECGARFRERKNLVAHSDEVHRKRRKFGCKHARCNVVSNRRYNMHRHERLMHARPCRTPCSACGNTPLVLPPECIPTPSTMHSRSHQSRIESHPTSAQASSSSRIRTDEVGNSSRNGGNLSGGDWFDGTLAPLEEVEAMFEMEAMFKHFMV